jgi:hypothetical protein
MEIPRMSTIALASGTSSHNFMRAPQWPLLRPAGGSDTPSVQRQLNAFYLRELGAPGDYGKTPQLEEYGAIAALEQSWNTFEESRIDLDHLPTDAASFTVWYSKLHREHRHAVAPFFEILSERASLRELAFYVSLEEQVDGRFDDVIALAQLGMTDDMKLALAENYWDEMGCGNLADLHTTLFAESVAHLRGFLGGIDLSAMVPDAALRNGNLLLMYALRRRYLPRLLGALALLEHTAPYRFARLVRGLRRFDMPESVIRYHELHIEVDARHGKQILQRVLLPLVTRHPEMIRELCTGCLIRHNIAVDYYQSIETAMQDLGLRSQIATAVH